MFVKSGTVLKIKAGTRIFGTPGSFLAIERGAKIVAKGKANRPIVFTSSKENGERRPGDWGGLLILGGAPVNRCPAGDCTPEGLPPGVQFGGSNPAEDSGTLQYVRVEFAGFELRPTDLLQADERGFIVGSHCPSRHEYEHCRHEACGDLRNFEHCDSPPCVICAVTMCRAFLSRRRTSTRDWDRKIAHGSSRDCSSTDVRRRRKT